MKILQVVHSFLPHTMAGTEIYSYRLSKELAKKHDVFVFYRINNPKEKEFIIHTSNLDGLKTYAINNTLISCESFANTYKNSKIDKKFGEILDKITPDIIHIHHLLFLSHGLVEEAKKRNIPIIYTLHDYWLLCYKGQLIKENMSTCNLASVKQCSDCLKYLLSMKKNSFFIYNLLKRKLHPILLQGLKEIHLLLGKKTTAKQIEEFFLSTKEVSLKIDLFIAPTKFIKDKFIEYGFPAEKIQYSNNGFESKNLCNIKKKKSTLLRFAYLGTLLPMKGLNVLISAFKKIKNPNVGLFIYGKIFPYSGFEYYPKKLKKIIGNDTRIKLMGEYNNNELPNILTNIDIVVVPSLWFENSPLVIQEAFMAKIPVIASRIGGIPELITHDINGLLFNPGDETDLKNKIQYAIDNPNILKEFERNFPAVKSMEENAREIETAYKLLKY